MSSPENIVVYAAESALLDKAEMISAHVGAPLSGVPGEELTLWLDKDGLSLVGYGLRIHPDFSTMLRRISGGRLNHEMLVKMSKTKAEHPVAVDAAAGLGEDALLLSAAGYEVKLFERDAVIAALLRDAMKRALEVPELHEIVSRMQLTEGDSIELMPRMIPDAELVYLDPMFPERRKSGLINKKLQLLQKLERPCSQERELLESAISLHPRKIIIKRPLKGAFLAGRKPSYSVKGKAIRYDCIVLR